MATTVTEFQGKLGVNIQTDLATKCTTLISSMESEIDSATEATDDTTISMDIVKNDYGVYKENALQRAAMREYITNEYEGAGWTVTWADVNGGNGIDRSITLSY